MKILAFVDSHANSQAYAVLRERASKADIVLCAGDISIFGSGLDEALGEMNSWNKAVYLIHGNHEDEELLIDVNEHYKNIHFVHKKEIAIGNVLIWGYGGGGFAQKDPELEKFAKKFKPHPKRIMMFHGPPHGTATDFKNDYEGHVGCLSRRKIIDELKPLIAISGHIHETFNANEKVGRTLFLNPGPIGKLIDIKESLAQKKTATQKKART